MARGGAASSSGVLGRVGAKATPGPEDSGAAAGCTKNAVSDVRAGLSPDTLFQAALSASRMAVAVGKRFAL